MIISDLSHFEEVVFEAPSIVGGATTTSFPTAIPSYILKQLPREIRALLRGVKGKVITLKTTNKNGYASVTTGIFKQGKVNVSFSSSTSVS